MRLDLSTAAGAIFDETKRYRYILWRRWSMLEERGLMLLVAANPSKADAERSDPTVSQMRGRAERMGLDGLIVCNTLAYVSTDPKGLFGVEDPCGPLNDDYIVAAARVAKIIVCAWGLIPNDARSNAVHELLLRKGFASKLHVLGITKDGRPRHPRAVPLSTELKPWQFAALEAGRDKA